MTDFSLRVPGSNTEIQYEDLDNSFNPHQENHPHNSRRREFIRQKRDWLLQKLADDIEADIDNSDELRENLVTAENQSISTFITEYEVAFRLIDLGFSLTYEPDLSDEIDQDNPKVPDFEAKRNGERFFVEVKTRNNSDETIEQDRFLEKINSHLSDYNRGFQLRLRVREYSLDETSNIAHKIIQKLEEVDKDEIDGSSETDICLDGDVVANFKIVGTRSDDDGSKVIFQTPYRAGEMSGSIRSLIDDANQKDVPSGFPLLLFCKLKETVWQNFVESQVYGDSEIHIIDENDLEGFESSNDGEYVAIEGERKFGKFNSGAGSISSVSGAIFYGFSDSKDCYYRNENSDSEISSEIISEIMSESS